MEKDLKDLNDRLIRVEEKIEHLLHIMEKYDHAKAFLELELLKKDVDHLKETQSYLKADIKELKASERKHSESYTADKAGIGGWMKGFIAVFTLIELYKLVESFLPQHAAN